MQIIYVALKSLSVYEMLKRNNQLSIERARDKKNLHLSIRVLPFISPWGTREMAQVPNGRAKQKILYRRSIFTDRVEKFSIKGAEHTNRKTDGTSVRLTAST